jgi:hypothetical protein
MVSCTGEMPEYALTTLLLSGKSNSVWSLKMISSFGSAPEAVSAIPHWCPASVSILALSHAPGEHVREHYSIVIALRNSAFVRMVGFFLTRILRVRNVRSVTGDHGHQRSPDSGKKLK